VPAGNFLIPSVRKLVLAGKLKIVQWSQTPLGALKSSQIRTKDLASLGTSTHCRGRGIFSPSQE